MSAWSCQYLLSVMIFLFVLEIYTDIDIYGVSFHDLHRVSTGSSSRRRLMLICTGGRVIFDSDIGLDGSPFNDAVLE